MAWIMLEHARSDRILYVNTDRIDYLSPEPDNADQTCVNFAQESMLVVRGSVVEVGALIKSMEESNG